MLRDSWFPRFPKSVKISRPHLGLLILLMGLLAPLLIAACGGDDPTAIPQTTATNTPQPTAATATQPPAETSTQPAPDPTSTSVPELTVTNTVEVSSQGSLGSHLVDADGMTLYLFTKDERNVSNCAGPCADMWPPLVADGDPVAGEGLDAERLATIQREDGISQVTYNGKPLYHFANDQTPADTLGQDRVDKWYVVSPDGGPIRTSAAVNSAGNGNFGTILMDASGRSLYLFTKDERNVSNCAGGCALAWPPLLTVDDPAPGEGLAEDRIGTISRSNGAKQVTYNGWPLYYFAKDEKPGDAMGQDVGGVWFVVTTDGGAIYTKAPVNASENGDFGTILMDAAGRSLYLFTKDERNVSNCAGGCALAWPPLITVEDPVPGEGLNEDRIGTTTRADGAKQVTYNGWPLYYFAKDEIPGDAMGQDVGGVWFVVTTNGGAVFTKAPVNAALNFDFGNILMDASGRSLYLFTKDERNVSNCAGGCALAWPPLITVEDPVPGEGLAEDRIGTTTRADGAKQVTYNGWPLYYFAKDEKPGDAMGQDVGGVWFVVTTDGGAVYTKAPVEASGNGDFGTILMDAAGRSLYLFTKDERNVSNCAGGCALAWPPLITVEDPVPGEGLAEDRIGTTTRADGAKQVTYNGWPLYYFAKDEKPGDAMGQDVGGVWFVVTTDGGAVYTNAPVNASENGDLGTILMDAAGRSLYLFTKDDPNVSNCAGGCALAWPPLITVNDPTPGEGVSAARIGTTTREDGSKQVTFDGNPLYYYAKDEKPGDAMGQDVGSVWYVINNSQPLMIALGEQNDSGQTGTAVLAGRGSFTNVSLSLSAGTLETELAHIHSGQCVPGALGGVVHALTSFEGGSGASVTNVPTSLDSLMTGAFAVNTHKTGESSTYTSCGNIPTAEDSLTIALGELNGSGQTGFVSLTARGLQTEVVVSATSGISALAHIHDGSCQTLGGVVHPLSDTSGSISSSTVDATLESLIAGDFAVNLHTPEDTSVYSSCGDI